MKKAYQAPTVINLTGREDEAGCLVGIGIGAVWGWVVGPVAVWP